MTRDAPPTFETVGEVRGEAPFPLYVQPAWQRAMPWLFQGTTAPGDSEPFDLGLRTPARLRSSIPGYARIAAEAGCHRAVVARQVHGRRILTHGSGQPGVRIAEAADGHRTSERGLLLAVTVADCVPVFIVDPGRQRIALLHAGWRGTAAGILEAALDAMAPAEIAVHLGPAICGECYEVGPEVHTALGLPTPAAPQPVDLRLDLAERAARCGVPPARISVSAWCTRCGDSPFASYRAGNPVRQAGVLALRPQV